MSRVPWFIKHKPKRVDDVINQDEAKKILIPWIKQWFEGKTPDKKAVLLYGPAGCGKTSLVEAIANEYNLELIELNASDTRSKEGLERVVKTTISLRSLTKRGKLILLDEVDGISPREEYGAVETIVDLISKTMYPIVLTANDPWSQHLKPIRDVSILIQFKRLTEAQVVQGLRRICQAEGIRCDDDSLRELAKRSEGDMRS
ncbi:MAG: replication factor C large subunit, partial [Desulfurococcaceae archaeon]